jgi:hypothetical protein
VPDAALMPPDPAYLVASTEISQVIDKQFQQPVLFLIYVSSDCVKQMIDMPRGVAPYNTDSHPWLWVSVPQYISGRQ